MQKVEGSSPFIRSSEKPRKSGLSRFRAGAGNRVGSAVGSAFNCSLAAPEARIHPPRLGPSLGYSAEALGGSSVDFRTDHLKQSPQLRGHQGGIMRGRSALLIAGLAVTGSVLASTPATAKPIDKGQFHDVFTSDVYDCDGTQAEDSGDVSGNFVFNQRGSSPFPYYRESVRGSIVTTNLENDGTYTNVFTANSRDHTTFDIDYNGTPGDPGDDVEVPDSFRVVRDSTGRNDLAGRDFCADLVEFTSQ